MTDELKLKVGGVVISGWTDIRVTRGIERFPSDFTIALTDKDPATLAQVTGRPGDACQVLLGDDVVVTGYVDRLTPSYTATGYRLTLSGRGKGQDLVDASAEWPGGQIAGANVQAIAEKLASAYGIKVTTVGDPGKVIPQFNLTLGQSAWEIIEEICRYEGLLAYELADGSLRLGPVGATIAASGFVEGQNVEAGSVAFSINESFSEYDCFLTSQETFGDVTGPADQHAGNLIATVKDPNVRRNRKRYIICEAVQGGIDLAQRRAVWEAQRRAGRGSIAQITCDSWRDGNGALWTPNTLAPVSLPSLRLAKATWLISEVTYRLDASGTHADLVLGPPTAFAPQPVQLQPVVAGIV